MTWFTHLRDRLTSPLPIAPLARLERFVRTRPASDQLIIGTLGVLVTLASISSTYALMRSVMVPVPVHGGSLTEGIAGTPRFVNPLLALTDADRDLTTLTYAGLMGIGANGTLVPVLAQSYEVAENGTVYTFTLRSGITFSDGSPVTADDVVFTVEKAQDPALKSPEYANWANVRVEAVDPHTVRFTLPKAYAPFLENATLGILPARIWRNIPDDQFPFSTYMTNPVGAGPFTVLHTARNASGAITRYDLVAFKHYALGEPYLSRFTIKFYDTSAEVLAAYKKRQIESAYGISVAGAKSAPYARTFGVFFNSEHEPAFKELAVRKALSIAIDRDHLTHDLLGGHATPLNGPLPPGSPVAEPAVPASATRVDDARAVLEHAGWSFDEAAGVWRNASKKLTLESITLTTANVPELRTIASAIQADWQAIGVSSTIELYEPGDLTQQVIRPRNFSALFFGMVVGRGQDLYAFWDSAEAKESGLNITGYSDSTVDSLLSKARSESNPAVADGYLADAAARISADYPAAFTYAPDFLYAVPNNVKGVYLPQIGTPRDRFATVASWYRDQAYVWPFLVSE